MINRADVLAAEKRIKGYVRRTPLLRAGTDAAPLWLKCEFMQHTGVFKARGAFNRLLAARERGELNPAIGVVAASGGNAGLANAYAAAALGVPATVFVPEAAPRVKVERLLGYGATVHQVGAEYAEAYAAAIRYVEESGALFCHAYDQLEIAAGAGTVAEEILEDEPGVDTIIVAVGGGGLYAGVAAAAEGRARVVAAAEDRARVVAVEPFNIPTLNAALAAGHPVDVPVSGIAADSLGARRVGEIAFNMASRVPPTSVLVDDSAIASARSQLWSEYRIPAEYGAAAALSALTSGAYVPREGERIAVIVCGANTDASTLEYLPESDKQKASR
ncbi:threonine/serine dehydratase [Pseudarthrobacter sp. MM222]|uniref:threonine/serine dehydratase n=1 Tax=Pseudarthrobacter sp. MM222 TaxID=3018929 RepID=UPI00221FC34C|nr:threonine/serine dehydratase [Pseudarthrobacter sp. MM222]CAI3803968.1 Phenylserine dehydratase [Pseudarthrobacter sp. MM222]